MSVSVTPATSNLLVEAKGLRKSFGALEVLKGIDLTVAPGEVVCIVGASGSGKSTFLRCINDLEKFDAGELTVDGEPVGCTLRNGRLYELSPTAAASRRARIGMVFQHFNLFPHMTVLENIIEAPVQVLKQKKAESVELAMTLLKRVGMLERRNAYPSQLSGGQKQRVAIARALAMEPRLMLFDEPTSARRALLNIELILKDAGCSLSDICRVFVYLRNLDDYDGMNAAYAEIMKPPFPPRSAVYVGMPRNLLVQIEVFAYKPNQQ